MVLVICIITMERTARAQANQYISGAGINAATVKPMMELKMWPPNKFRGCAKGLLVAPNSSTAVAPKGPVRNKFSKI